MYLYRLICTAQCAGEVIAVIVLSDFVWLSCQLICYPPSLIPHSPFLRSTDLDVNTSVGVPT